MSLERRHLLVDPRVFFEALLRDLGSVPPDLYHVVLCSRGDDRVSRPLLSRLAQRNRPNRHRCHRALVGEKAGAHPGVLLELKDSD